MNLTPQQVKKVEKVAKFMDDINSATVESFIEVDDKLDEIESKIEGLNESIQAIEIPEQKDHTGHMEKMMDMMNEPLEVEVTLNII